MKIHNRTYLKDRRQDLRNSLTPPEARLWKILKGKQILEFKFRRQHSIKNYIVDFYCPKAKLIIEIDGLQHNEPGICEEDIKRDTVLQGYGFTILRFSNLDIMNQINAVIQEIEQKLKELSD